MLQPQFPHGVSPSQITTLPRTCNHGNTMATGYEYYMHGLANSSYYNN